MQRLLGQEVTPLSLLASRIENVPLRLPPSDFLPEATAAGRVRCSARLGVSRLVSIVRDRAQNADKTIEKPSKPFAD